MAIAYNKVQKKLVGEDDEIEKSNEWVNRELEKEGLSESGRNNLMFYKRIFESPNIVTTIQRLFPDLA